MSFKVELRSEDGKPITERTVLCKIRGVAAVKMPVKGQPFIVAYDEGQIEHLHEDASPGMVTWPVFVENIGDEYRYKDEMGRPFLVRYL